MRVLDIIFEFAPTTPEEDEEQLAALNGEQPQVEPEETPVAQAQPAPVAQAQPQPDERSSILASVVSSKLRKLVADANSIPDWEPAKRLVLDLIKTLTSDNILKESKSIDISPEEIAIAIKNIKFLETQGLMKLDETVDLALLAVKMVKNAKKEFKTLEKKYVLRAEEITNTFIIISRNFKYYF